MSEFRPLTKEILKEYVNEHQYNVKHIREKVTSMTREKYYEIIKLAVKGDTKYVFPLTNINSRSKLSATTQQEYRIKFINELIRSLYLVLPDSNIQYNEKNI